MIFLQQIIVHSFITLLLLPVKPFINISFQMQILTTSHYMQFIHELFAKYNVQGFFVVGLKYFKKTLIVVAKMVLPRQF